MDGPGIPGDKHYSIYHNDPFYSSQRYRIRFIRRGIKNNLLFRHLAVKLDDVFFGQNPSVRPLPDWAEITERP